MALPPTFLRITPSHLVDYRSPVDLPDPKELPTFTPDPELTQVENEAAYKEQFPKGVTFARSMAVKEHLVENLQACVDRFRYELVNDETARRVEYDVAAMLKRYQEGGFLPASFSTSYVTLRGSELDPTAPIVDLPAFVRVWMTSGDGAFVAPRFTHDCKQCQFLAHHEYAEGVEDRGPFDFYYCGKQVTGATVIARFGNEGPEYLSGLEIGQRQGIDRPLGLAYALAREKGLIQ
jgi:hypothetical protein